MRSGEERVRSLREKRGKRKKRREESREQREESRGMEAAVVWHNAPCDEQKRQWYGITDLATTRGGGAKRNLL